MVYLLSMYVFFVVVVVDLSGSQLSLSLSLARALSRLSLCTQRAVVWLTRRLALLRGCRRGLLAGRC
jgi:hypothetical protein